MIAMLRGQVEDIRGSHIVLDVGGVGYLVAVRAPLDFKLNETVSFHTHLAVRENALDLYGFVTRDEREMFEHLLKLPKIGPKSAMQILTQADIPLLKKAVINGDATYLSKMSGIGKKSAEKIVSGLRDIFDGADYFGEGSADGSDSDTIDALVALGYPQRDAREALGKIDPEVTGTNDRLKAALRLLGS